MKLTLRQIHKGLAYNQWANDRLIQSLTEVSNADYTKSLPVPFDHIHGLLQHLHDYDTKYYHELVDGLLEHKTEKKLSRTQLADRINLYSEKWLIWIEKMIDSENIFDEKLCEKIINLNTHNTYHRGQIYILISMLGYKPQSIDIFHYLSTLSEISVEK